MTLDAILAEAAGAQAAHVVVTGGEPMIAPEIVKLTQGLKSLGQHITIETAGTVFAPVACDLMSISPKLSNSTPYEREGGRWAAQHERLRYQPEVLRKLMEIYEYQLKFVVSRPEDIPELVALVQATGADRSRVILMPEGVDARQLQERGRWIVEACKAEKFRFSPRLHVELWGNRRAV